MESVMGAKSISAVFLVFAMAVSCQKSSNQDDCINRSFIHEYGVSVGGEHWNTCGKNGQVISFLRNGVCLTETYSEGVLNGESVYTFPHSEQTERVEVYANGNLCNQVYYSLSGTPRKSIHYESPEQYTVTEWYETGNPKSIEKYERSLLLSGEYYNEMNQKDSWVYNGNGERMTRDEMGNFICLDTFNSGVLTQKTYYHPNGTPKEICAYVNGVPHGERKTYYPGGEPMAIETWMNGEQNGTTIIFQNGEKYAEVPYLSNKRNGLERRFRDGCIVTQEVTWADDKMHGPTFTYAGDTIQTDWFYKGRLTSRSNYESFAMPKK